MSRFYGTIQGDGEEVNRQGNSKSGIVGEIAGENIGIRVLGTPDENGEDVFIIYKTPGAKQDFPSVEIGRVKEVYRRNEGAFLPASKDKD